MNIYPLPPATLPLLEYPSPPHLQDSYRVVSDEAVVRLPRPRSAPQLVSAGGILPRFPTVVGGVVSDLPLEAPSPRYSADNFFSHFAQMSDELSRLSTNSHHHHHSADSQQQQQHTRPQLDSSDAVYNQPYSAAALASSVLSGDKVLINDYDDEDVKGLVVDDEFDPHYDAFEAAQSTRMRPEEEEEEEMDGEPELMQQYENRVFGMCSQPSAAISISPPESSLARASRHARMTIDIDETKAAAAASGRSVFSTSSSSFHRANSPSPSPSSSSSTSSTSSLVERSPRTALTRSRRHAPYPETHHPRLPVEVVSRSSLSSSPTLEPRTAPLVSDSISISRPSSRTNTSTRVHPVVRSDPSLTLPDAVPEPYHQQQQQLQQQGSVAASPLALPQSVMPFSAPLTISSSSSASTSPVIITEASPSSFSFSATPSSLSTLSSSPSHSIAPPFSNASPAPSLPSPQTTSMEISQSSPPISTTTLTPSTTTTTTAVATPLPSTKAEAVSPPPPISPNANPDEKVEEQDFECGLCLSLLCDPISIPCGHTFCQPCLVSTLERSKKQCPTCRSPCHVDAERLPVNVLLANLIRKLFPAEYAKRKAIADEEKKEWQNRISLFYMGDNQFPGHKIHLRLFEPRYLLMAKRALAGDRRFGFMPGVLPEPGDVGVVLHIDECEFMHDGAALVACSMQERFRVTRSWQEHNTFGLDRAQVEYFKDEVKVEPNSGISPEAALANATSAMSSSVAEAVPLFKRLIPLMSRSTGIDCQAEYGEMPPFIPSNPLGSGEKISFYMCNTMMRFMPSALKKSLVSTRDTVFRMRSCISLARTLVQSLESRLQQVPYHSAYRAAVIFE